VEALLQAVPIHPATSCHPCTTRTLVFTATVLPITDRPLPLLRSLRMLNLRNTSWTSARKSLVWKRCSRVPSGSCKVSVVVWMRCESESSSSLSANTRLRGRDNPHLLDQSLLLPLDPHTKSKNAPPLSLRCPFLYRGTDPSHLPWPRKPCGTSSRSRPVFDLAVFSPYPVFTAIISSLWFLPLSRVWVLNVRPAVVLFYNLALLVLRLICSPPFYAGQLPPSSFISHNLHTPGLWISFRVCVFLLLLPRRCVFSLVLSCSRSYHMCILLFFSPFPPFVVYIFYPPFLLF